MASALPGTRAENLGSSNKRARGPNLYSQLLPLAPTPPSFLSSFLSLLPNLSLSPPLIQAIYDDLTKSVWVQGEDDMIRLWRQGFFGKGALSRSDPSWKRRVENKRAEAMGGTKTLTSEEITAQRRIERKISKHIKAAERDAEKLLAATLSASERGSAIGSPAVGPKASTLPAVAEDEDVVEATLDVIVETAEEADTETPQERDDVEAEEVERPAPPPVWQLSAEHMQLQPEEAFFLLFALPCLSLQFSDPFAPLPSTSSPPPPLSILQTWTLFLSASSPCPSAGLPDPCLSRFDNPFLLQYAAYHHFRSLGWVVRSGVKFCADWVLYGPGGPVGGHAEFAVLVIPNYADPADELTSPFRSTLLRSGDGDEGADSLAAGEGKNTWRWFNTVNRVCSGVKKTLVLLHVLIPAQSSLPSPNFIAENPAQAMAMLQLREVTVRRWMAGRMRD